MKIRKEQMDAFQPLADEAFVHRVVEYLREHNSNAVFFLDDDRLDKIVREGIARARSYGLTGESSLTAFVALTVEIAPHFDRHPAVRKVLQDQGVPPNERIDALIDRLSDEDWDEAARGDDATSDSWG